MHKEEAKEEEEGGRRPSLEDPKRAPRQGRCGGHADQHAHARIVAGILAASATSAFGDLAACRLIVGYRHSKR